MLDKAVRIISLLALGALCGCAVTNQSVRVRSVSNAERPTPESGGINLCLSGGGYRATLFHAGLLRQMNDRRLLRRINTITGVSGGAITAGQLVRSWEELEFDRPDDQGRAMNFEAIVIDPLIELTSTTIDVSAFLSTLNPLGSNRIAEEYAEMLGDVRFSDLATDQDAPRLVVLATELSSGQTWEISSDRIGHTMLGYVENPDLRLADAIAASSAFPMAFRPIHLQFDEPVVREPTYEELREGIYAEMTEMGYDPALIDERPEETNQLSDQLLREIWRESYSDRIGDDVYLVDGGLVNNLGDTHCSDAGALNIVSSATTTNDAIAQDDPSSLSGAMVMTINAMHANIEGAALRRLRATHRGNKSRQVCSPSSQLSCIDGTVIFIDYLPFEVLGQIPVDLDIPTRLAALEPATQIRLLDNGSIRFEDEISALTNEDTGVVLSQ